MVLHLGGIIAAIAFLILVCFIGIFLMRMTRTLGEINHSINLISNDVDAISAEAEKILASSNELLKDVNGKVATIDPAFQAVADLGQSVSDLNNATRDLTTKVGSNKKKKSGTVAKAASVGKAAFDVYRDRRNKTK